MGRAPPSRRPCSCLAKSSRAEPLTAAGRGPQRARAGAGVGPPVEGAVVTETGVAATGAAAGREAPVGVALGKVVGEGAAAGLATGRRVRVAAL